MLTPTRWPLHCATVAGHLHRHAHPQRSVLSAYLVSLLVAAACHDQGPTTGSLRITVNTTGGDLDLDGYALTIDAAAPQSIAVTGTVMLPDLPTGAHVIELIGLAANCTVAAQNPRSVTVRGGRTVDVSFVVSCVATGFQITTPTTGADVDPDGFTVAVDDAAPQSIGVNGVVTVTRLTAGSHTIHRGGIATNCTVAAPNPRTVTIATGEVAPVVLGVTCVATTGNIEVTTATVGIDLDADGYTVQLDGGPAQALGINGTARFEGLAGGDHSVSFAGSAGNCSIAGANPRTLPVSIGGAKRDTVRATFQVTCVAVTGSILVTAATTGIDLDPNGYTVLVDGGQLRPLPLNGTVLIEGLAGRDHSLGFSGAAANCPVAGANPRTVHVTTGGTTRDTARTTFDVTCVAVTGTVQVTTTVSGVDPDPNGFSALLDDGQSRPVVYNGSVLFTGVSAGDHSVVLFDLASNCTVNGPNQQTVHVTTGGTTRDTARTSFQVTCVAVEKIAFERDQNIVVAYADGSNAVQFALGTGPTWSPDGTKIAYAAINCDYYYDYYCYPVGISVQGLVQLTSNPSDLQPAWSPDGTKIAFTSSRSGRPGLWVISAAGGSAATLITDNPRSVSEPAWSPDGTQLAFTCLVDTGNTDICRINANGTGFVRLTSDPAYDAGPAWKPGSSTIAFATTRYGGGGAPELAVMNADGGGVARVSPGTAASDPAWSPDGTKLVFVGFPSCTIGNCRSSGLQVMNADGTGITRLTSSADYAPAWRP